MDSTQSFTARRSAASTLPPFQLPAPDLSSMNKYQSYQPVTTQPLTSVLTPPSALTTDLSPLSSSVNSGSSGSSTTGIPPYGHTQGYWPNASSNYTYNTAPQLNGLYGAGRQLYSPGMSQFAQRSSNSPATGDGYAPPNELNLPPFPSANGSHAGSQSLPTLAPQQHQQQLANLMMNSQQPASQTPQHGPIHAPDNYGGRPPPTPTYNTFPPSLTPQQSSFPTFTHPSPTHQSPISAPPQNRISPVSAQHSMHPPPGQYNAQRYNGYPLPAMSGPIMSNMHNPGSQMALVGGMPMNGYPAQQLTGHMYGQHSNPQQQQNDRPFKCDQCPQSFNRNHDLKRHKRIHLAVKPFPCTHCEKSFSRKDALKRHILVKGCGKAGQTTSTLENGDSESPIDKTETMSDSADDSPDMVKKEL